MDVTYQKDVCFFVGGIGAKTGVSRAGGCTKAWLAAKNGDPSGLFGADGACVYSNASIQIGSDSRITGANGTFAGVEIGMVAYLDASDFDAGYYEVTDVGTNDEYVEFGGADEVFLPEYLLVYIGGAFDSLHTAYFHTGAWIETCHILTNKDETLGATLTLHYAGGNPARNTWKETIGYNTNVFIENNRVVSDMDKGKAAYQSVLDVFQNGATAGKKVVLDGSALAAMAVSWKVDNFVMRNIHIKAGASYACCEPETGTPLQYTGAEFVNCVFDGGADGVKPDGVADFVRCVNCFSNASGTGFNLNDAGIGARSSVLIGCVADGCAVGFSVSGGGSITGCITDGCTDGIETNGACGVVSCVFYDCGSHAFVCSDADARWFIFNSIAVLDPLASGVFGVGSGGGSVVFEDHNCFVDTAGNAVTLHDSTNWSIDYVPSLIGANTLEADPVFADAAGKVFSLADESPCVNAGLVDIYGNASHIGFYETPESAGGGTNVQANRNRQYGVGRNQQYA
ncbi:MAG: hypothetical protein B6I25_06345 [Planctomycetales bacterium 4572_13]|nr:MAG: hypothetical protein B6I25_06345 [Planctomycetales bacterium 4572_13]